MMRLTFTTTCLALAFGLLATTPASAAAQCGACLADKDGPTQGHAIVNSSTMPDYEPTHEWEFGESCCACHDQSCGQQAAADLSLPIEEFFDLKVDLLNAFTLDQSSAVRVAKRLGGEVDWDLGLLRVALCDGEVEVPLPPPITKVGLQ